MEISRFKKVLAGISVAALSLAQAGTVFAYTDVPAGSWYEEAVDAFVAAGHLDASQARFRGGDLATRGEFVKLVVLLNGGVLSTPPAVGSFDDVAPSAWYYEYFEEAGVEGWVRGDGDCYGTRPCYARPNANVNRAEAAALITRSFALDATGAAPLFVDNPPNQWYTAVIQTAADNCVLQGDDYTGRVRPGDNMNRAEMVVMLNRADQELEFGVDCGLDVLPPPPAEPEIGEAEAANSTTVAVDFNVEMDVSVDETYFSVANGRVISVIDADWINDHVVELTLADPMVPNEIYTVSATDVRTVDGVEFSDTASFAGYTEIVMGDGILSVTISPTSPVGDTVPKGARAVELLALDLNASCDDDVVLEEITIVKEGLGAESDIEGVYAMVDNTRISRKRTIDNDSQTADLRLSTPLVISRCGSATVKVVADISGTAQPFAEHNVVVQLPTDVKGNAQKVEGNFPLRGDTFRIAAVQSGVLTVDYRTVTPSEVEVGDTKVVIGKYQFTASSTEDQTLYAVTLENDGSSSDGDFINIGMRRTSGTMVTNTAYSTQADFVTLEFDPPLTITEGDKLVFEVVADIVDGASNNIKMQFEEDSDIFAVGSKYGFGVNGQLYGSQVTISTTPSPSIVTIDAGEFTVTIDGPSTKDYTTDTDDAVLANMIFQTGTSEPIDVKDLFIAVEATTSTGQQLGYDTGTTVTLAGSYDEINEVLDDVQIRNSVTNRTIDGVRLTTTGTSGAGAGTTGTFQIYRFDDFIIRGKETWQFEVDFKDNGSGNHPTDGDKFRIHICGEGKEENNTANTTTCTFGGLISGSTDYQADIEGLSTGDKVQDFRPGGTITGQFQRISAAELQLTVQNIGTSETTVKGAKGVTLIRFEATANEAEDILMTAIAFASGSSSSTYSAAQQLQSFTNYTLWADTDNDNEVDTKLEDNVSESQNAVSFNELDDSKGFVIPHGKTVIMEVKADVQQSAVANYLKLKIKTDSTTGYAEVDAEQADDNDVLTAGTEIILSPTDPNISKVWLISNKGNLYVRANAQDRNHLLLGGIGAAAQGSVLNLEFRSEDEPIDVREIRVTSSGNTASTVESLALFISGESEPFATAGTCSTNDQALSIYHGATPGTNAAKTFCASLSAQQFVVPEGQRLFVSVKPNIKKEENADTTSGQQIEFFVNQYALTAAETGSGSVRAEGLESSETLITNNSDGTKSGEVFFTTTSASGANSRIMGQQNKVTFAKVASITNGYDDSVGNLTSGRRSIGAFKFTLASSYDSNGKDVNGGDSGGANEATLSGLIVKINAANSALNPFAVRLYREGYANTYVTCDLGATNRGTKASSGSGTGGVIEVKCNDVAATLGELSRVDQNDGYGIFHISADVLQTRVNAQGKGSITVSLTDYNNYSNSGFGTTAGQGHVQWMDTESGNLNNGTSSIFVFIEQDDESIASTKFED